MIQIRPRPYYYLKIHYGGDSEILNCEYERGNGNISEYELTSDSADEDEWEVKNSIKELVLMLKEYEKNIESS